MCETGREFECIRSHRRSTNTQVEENSIYMRANDVSGAAKGKSECPPAVVPFIFYRKKKKIRIK